MRQELEESINNLIELLQNDEKSESVYQKYFENNPIVFKVLGYSQSYPKPRLPLINGEWLEPDFLLKRADGLFEILDLKTPQGKLVNTRRKHRTTFSQKVDEYISQVETYSEYFDDESNRDKVRSLYSYEIQKSPESLIIMGVDSNIDKKLIYSLLNRRSHKITLQTYDDVLSSLLFDYAYRFGNEENLSGLAWYALVTVNKNTIQRRQYIADIGNSPYRNRWSVYLDEHSVLRFEVIDSNGVPYSISVPPGTHGFDFGVNIHVICEFGSSEKFSIMRILINNRTVAEQQFQFPINIKSDFELTIGSDMGKELFGSFTLAACAFYNVVPTFRQRTALFQAMLKI